MDLSQNNIGELLDIQDKFIDTHIHLFGHTRKHYEFLSKIQQFVKKHRVHDSSSMDLGEWEELQCMGGFDNPYFCCLLPSTIKMQN
jgi:hypothetical protein